MVNGVKAAVRRLQRLIGTRHAYRTLLLESGAPGELLLEDLAEFCGAFETTVLPGQGEGAIDIAAREGRRQVWLHVQTLLNMSHRRIAEMQRQIIETREQDHEN